MWKTTVLWFGNSPSTYLGFLFFAANQSSKAFLSAVAFPDKAWNFGESWEKFLRSINHSKKNHYWLTAVNRHSVNIWTFAEVSVTVETAQEISSDKDFTIKRKLIFLVTQVQPIKIIEKKLLLLDHTCTIIAGFTLGIRISEILRIRVALSRKNRYHCCFFWLICSFLPDFCRICVNHTIFTLTVVSVVLAVDESSNEEVVE